MRPQVLREKVHSKRLVAQSTDTVSWEKTDSGDLHPDSVSSDVAFQCLLERVEPNRRHQGLHDDNASAIRKFETAAVLQRGLSLVLKNNFHKAMVKAILDEQCLTIAMKHPHAEETNASESKTIDRVVDSPTEIRQIRWERISLRCGLPNSKQKESAGRGASRTREHPGPQPGTHGLYLDNDRVPLDHRLDRQS